MYSAQFGQSSTVLQKTRTNDAIRHAQARKCYNLDSPTSTPFHIPENLLRDVHSHTQTSPRIPHRFDPGTSSSSPIISSVGLETCRKILVSACRICVGNDFDFQRLSYTISCTLTSMRPLHVSESKEAVAILTGTWRNGRSCKSPTTEEFTDWLRTFGSLFKIADNGRVSFGQQEMRYFLHNFRIQGIDPSHRSIAIGCIRQIELEEKLEDWEKVKNGASGFLYYAMHYWQHHYRVALRSSLSFRIAMQGKEGAKPGPPPSRAISVRNGDAMQIAVAAHDVQSGLEGLELEDHDWVIVTNE